MFFSYAFETSNWVNSLPRFKLLRGCLTLEFFFRASLVSADSEKTQTVPWQAQVRRYCTVNFNRLLKYIISMHPLTNVYSMKSRYCMNVFSRSSRKKTILWKLTNGYEIARNVFKILFLKTKKSPNLKANIMWTIPNQYIGSKELPWHLIMFCLKHFCNLKKPIDIVEKSFGQSNSRLQVTSTCNSWHELCRYKTASVLSSQKTRDLKLWNSVEKKLNDITKSTSVLKNNNTN